MDRIIKTELVTPQSLLIEKTALELAATFYEAGRSAGMTSKHKDARSFAKANVEQYIPKAVSLLMDIMANPATSQEQKDLIYDAFMERTNDKRLNDIGIKAFENNIPYLPDNVPKIYDKRTLDSVHGKDFLEGKKPNG